MTGTGHGMPPLDQVARWSMLRFRYPQASYSTASDGWFYGALRDEDVPLRASSLERLISTLEARERAGPAAGFPDGAADAPPPG